MNWLGKGAIAIAAAGATGFGGTQAIVAQWRRNPDPNNGKPPVWPAGERRTVTTDDGAELLVEISGAGPQIVLVHGLTSNHDDWGYVATKLVEQGFQVIGINQRGHGGSTAGSDGYGAVRHGRDLQQAFEALSLRRVVLAGHSMGGIAALSYAVGSPHSFDERVVGLGLVATTACTSRWFHRLGTRILASADTGHAERAPNLARVLGGLGALGAKPSIEMVDALLASGKRCPAETRYGAAMALRSYNVRGHIATIDCPTTVVAGTRDLVTFFIDNKYLAKNIAGAQLVEASGVGHMILWERVEETTNALAELARRTI